MVAVIAFGHNNRNNSTKRYLYSADTPTHRELSLLAHNLGLKYEIQVLNIRGPNALWPQPNYWWFMPLLPPITLHVSTVRKEVMIKCG